MSVKSHAFFFSSIFEMSAWHRLYLNYRDRDRHETHHAHAHHPHLAHDHVHAHERPLQQLWTKLVNCSRVCVCVYMCALFPNTYRRSTDACMSALDHRHKNTQLRTVKHNFLNEMDRVICLMNACARANAATNMRCQPSFFFAFAFGVSSTKYVSNGKLSGRMKCLRW